MLEACLPVLAVLASLCGFALLALGQDRHWSAVTGLDEGQRVPSAQLRGSGLAAQAVACALWVIAEGPGFGALLWGVSTTAAAMTIALTLTWRPQWLKALGHFLKPRA
ncbi:MAG: hypothetical protein RLY78_2683 [Pseudomonadota bacterium]|jgi:hypothetical protein